MKKWIVCYIVGNFHKHKIVWAKTETDAIKKARVKYIEDLILCE